jgi:hypothetical protein
VQSTTSEEIEKEEPSGDEDILAEAKERFRLAEEAERDIRLEALDDIRFSLGEQWEPQIKQQRELDRRPCLTINRLPQAIHQITNDQRQNRPSIKVSPVDDGADKDTAEIYQGLIRNIEYQSNADTAYDTAFDFSVRGGFGFFRVVSEYCDPMSFDQDLRIIRVKNPFTCFLDPYSREPDGSDANWGFAFDDLSEDDFKAQFPNAELSQMPDWESLGNQTPGWITGKSARVAEYYYKEFEETEICLLKDQTGATQVVKKSDLQAPVMLPPGVEIIQERKALIPIVHHLKINGIEILERTVWPGKFIPIIPVIGEEIDVDGERVVKGLVRDAKDSQRMYNFFASAEAETIALSPKAPWIIADGQIKGYEKFWKTANTQNHGYLPYVPTSLAGHAVPPPQRQTFEPAVNAITQARMMASDDVKATTAIYDASMGNRSNENSGIAIQRRASQAQTGNFHFIDNLSKSIRHCGRILVDAIPHFYDGARAIRTLGEDGQEQIVKINQAFQYKGEERVFDFSVGKYDVTVSTGPSFQTKRQEAAASMIEFTKAMPQQAMAISDLIAKNLDWPGAHDIAERLRKTLPPNLIDGDKDQVIPPQVKAQLDQMSQMNEALTQQLNAANEEIEQKKRELKSKERIEFAKLENQAAIEMAKLQSSEALTILSHQIAEISERLNLLRVDQPIEEQMPDAGPEMGFANGFEEQPPTGGPSPGQSHGENPWQS